jgi:large subunit ribosomal protein L18
VGKLRSTEVARRRRHKRIRTHVQGTLERPRLNVYRSLRHVYAQLIDDTAGHTILAVSTLDPEVRAQVSDLNKTRQAELVGKTLAQRARQQGVRVVVFDRGGNKYHGRVRALAEGARAEGLQF